MMNMHRRPRSWLNAVFYFELPAFSVVDKLKKGKPLSAAIFNSMRIGRFHCAVFLEIDTNRVMARLTLITHTAVRTQFIADHCSQAILTVSTLVAIGAVKRISFLG